MLSCLSSIAYIYQIRNDRANAVCTGQRQTTICHNLWRTVLSRVAGGHNNLGLIGVRDQVHGASHALEDLSGNHVIGKVTLCADLQSLSQLVSLNSSCTSNEETNPQDRHVNVPTPNHTE